MAGTFVCPFCFQELKKAKVTFACVNRGCTENIKTKQSIGKDRYVFAPPGIQIGLPKQAKCPACKTISTRWACPNCRNLLPLSIETSSDMIISIIGSRDSGKSNFVAVLVHELKRIFNPFGYSVSVADVSREDYARRFESKLYGNHRIVDRTESAAGGELDLPIICNIEKRVGNKLHQYTFSFMDSAGEDFHNSQIMERVMPYISKSKGIIFLLDPMQIEAVRFGLSSDLVSSSSNVEYHSVMSGLDIINNVADLIKKETKCKEITIPAVCSFSKIDTIKGLVPENTRIFQESPHSRSQHFVNNDAEMVSNEVKGLLAEWNQIDFIQNFESKFKKCCFLPCSAFGEAAVNGMLTRPHSLRIEDALLWILKENGIIPAE